MGYWIQRGGGLRYWDRAGGAVAVVRLGMRKGDGGAGVWGGAGGRCCVSSGLTRQQQQQQRGALTVLVHSLCSPFHQVELKTWSPCEYQWMCLENLLPLS